MDSDLLEMMSWVSVPEGSFVYGSPPDSLSKCRDKYTANQVQVTLTRSFRMAETEVTQAQWKAAGYPNPSPEPECDDCPVMFVSFYDAAAFCNELSKRGGLAECYDLSTCVGEIGEGCPDPENACFDEPGIFNCTGNIHRYGSYYDCPGYRLPTTAEWEYAARAGTPTQTYNGDLLSTEGWDGYCRLEPVLEPIAWYCNNTKTVQQVKQKQPNAFGLYDMLGNAWEIIDYVNNATALDVGEGKPGEALVDPIGVREGDEVDVRRGHYQNTGCYLAADQHFSAYPRKRHPKIGFRPVRTVLVDESK
ncbi:MAG: formylglycine-generating enzyme family protein [Myxococcota bacterium]|nr:formylglycine-generating enzyme family protein [Myxococcota bacterium]